MGGDDALGAWLNDGDVEGMELRVGAGLGTQLGNALGRLTLTMVGTENLVVLLLVEFSADERHILNSKMKEHRAETYHRRCLRTGCNCR